MVKTSYGILALAFALAVLPWMVAPWWPVRDPWNDFKWPALSFLIFFAVLLFLAEWKLFSCRKQERSVRIPLSFHLGAGMIVVGLIVSSLISPVPHVGIKLTVRESGLIALAWLLAARGVSAREVQILAGMLLFSSVAQAILLLGQHWGFLAPGGTQGRASMVGTFGNPEYVAGWLAPICAMSVVWFWMGSVSRWRRVGVLIPGIAGSAAIILSGGRGAALSLVFSVFVVLFYSHAQTPVSVRSIVADLRRRWMGFAIAGMALVLAVLCGALLPVLGQSVPGRLAEMFNPYSISIRHRLGLMTITSKMISAEPITGVGPGLFAVGFDQARGRLAARSDDVGPWVFNEIMSDQSAQEAHCDPLQWWAEYGLFPFLGLLLLLSSAMARLLRNRGSPEACLVMVALLTMTIGMFFSFPLHRPARALLFWTLVGIGHGLIFQGSSQSSVRN